MKGKGRRGLPRDFLWSEQDEADAQVAQVAVSGQAWRDSNLPQESGPVDLVERVLEVRGQEATNI